MTTNFYLPSRVLSVVAGLLILCPCAYSAAAANNGVSVKRASVPKPVHSARDVSASDHGRDMSQEQREYVQMAAEMRAADAAFVENIRKAGPTERRSLRLRQIEVMQPRFKRINELARALRKNRTQGVQSSAPTGIRVEGVPHPSEEIAGKSLDELARLGVRVDVLHQRADESGSNDSGTAQPDSKK